MRIQKKLCILVLTCMSILGPLACANAEQNDPILLTISGQALTTQQFNFETLSAIAPINFGTTTIWTDGVQSFEGVSLKVLLETMGITEGVISAKAVNDYAIEIPLSAISDRAPMIAYKQNGQRMSLRGKGPLWLVYPYDSAAEFQTEVIYSRSIWQLDRIEVK